MIVNTEAIVLNSRKYSESSKIVSMFSKTNGRISVLAKGARKPKNKFGASLDPLSYSMINFYFKSSRELHIISDSETIIPLRKIQESYENITAGLVIAEAVAHTLDINEANESLFNFFKEILIVLNDTSENPFSLSTYFLIKLSSYLGFEIDLIDYNILFPIDKQYAYFSLSDGCFTHDKMSHGNIFRFNIKSAEKLFQISQTGFESPISIYISNNELDEFKNFFANYFSFHLDKKFSFKSLSLLNK